MTATEVLRVAEGCARGGSSCPSATRSVGNGTSIPSLCRYGLMSRKLPSPRAELGTGANGDFAGVTNGISAARTAATTAATGTATGTAVAAAGAFDVSALRGARALRVNAEGLGLQLRPLGRRWRVQEEPVVHGEEVPRVVQEAEGKGPRRRRGATQRRLVSIHFKSL